MMGVLSKRRKGLPWAVGCAIAFVLVVAAATFKPVRILVPQMFGLNCTPAGDCVDDLERLAEAEQLRDDAVAYVEQNIGPLREVPHFLFCSTRSCFGRFSDPDVAALYFWGAGTILVNEPGWRPHILRHELIHHWQKENLGGARAALRLPRWYIEGMAYVLSDDPRIAVPNEEAEGYRQRFLRWQALGNDWRSAPE